MNPDNGKPEGPRAFSVLLQEIDEGSVHAEVSKELHRLNSELYELALASGSSKGVKGSVTLKISVTTFGNGQAMVAAEVDTKIPKPKRIPSMMYVTKGGNLSVENERQLKLGIREVKTDKEPARDVTAEAGDARSV